MPVVTLVAGVRTVRVVVHFLAMPGGASFRLITWRTLPPKRQSQHQGKYSQKQTLHIYSFARPSCLLPHPWNRLILSYFSRRVYRIKHASNRKFHDKLERR